MTLFHLVDVSAPKKIFSPPPKKIPQFHPPGPSAPSSPGSPPTPGASNSPFPLPEQKKQKNYPKRPPSLLPKTSQPWRLYTDAELPSIVNSRTIVWGKHFQKNPRVHKISVRNSGAGNGCANFMGTWKNCVLSAGKPMSIKFLVLGGVFWVFWGGEVPILFLWARGFFWHLLRNKLPRA